MTYLKLDQKRTKMVLDEQLEIAIREAVQDAGESNHIALKLIAWIENVMDGSENPLDESSYARHLELIYDEMLSSEEEQ